MKTSIYSIMTAVLLANPFSADAQECNVPLSVIVDNSDGILPDAVANAVENSLERVVTAKGMSSDLKYGQFILVPRIDVLDKSIHQGPPVQIVNNLGVTLYIADAYSKTKFSSVYMEVDGVGNSEIKSMMAAVRQLNASNGRLVTFIEAGKKKIMDYYDRNYRQILSEARRKAEQQQYEEAIMLATSIPVCSRGGDEATAFGIKIYTKYRDRCNLEMLNKAKIIWAANPTSHGAHEAGIYLAAIDPEAACYNDVTKLYLEIKGQVRSDLDFEIRKKYNDKVAIEKQRIESMRAIGVAFGNGQKPTTTNLMWLR